MDQIWTVRLGLVRYDDARLLQREVERGRQDGLVPDVLLLLEHPPVYTKGRRAKRDELPMGGDWYRARGIDVVDTDRGGQVTYHGPGQLVGYPIVGLRPYGNDVHAYIRRMERTIVGALGDWGVAAEVVDGLTGVWTPERRKIGSIGVHVSRGVTTHGFAINVNNDLQPFEWIVPCGIESCRMTSLARELDSEQDQDAFSSSVRDHFGEIYERDPREVSAAELEERLDVPVALA